MKNKLLALVLMLCLALTLFSCEDQAPDTAPDNGASDNGESPAPEKKDPLEGLSEKERAFYILRLDETNLPDVNSVTSTVHMQVTGSMMDMPYEIKSTMTMRISGIKQGDYFYCESEKTDIDMMDGAYASSTNSESGFADGKMFYYYDDGEKETALFSKLSANDYRLHDKAMESEDGDFMSAVTEESCATVTCVASSDGSLLATFTGFTEEGLDALLESFDGIADMFDADIADAELKFTVDADLRPKTVRIAFLFEEGSDDAFTVDGKFEKYNETAPIAIDFSDYTEIEDLRIVDIAKKAIDDAQDAPFVSFRTREDTSIASGGETLDVTELYDITVRNGKNGYTFDMDVTADGETYYTWYEDGEYSMQLGTETDSVEMSEREARALLKAYFDPASLTLSIVTDAEEKGGVYLFAINELDTFSTLLSSLGATEDDVVSRDAFIAVKVEDGALASYVLRASITFDSFYGEVSVEYAVKGESFDFTE